MMRHLFHRQLQHDQYKYGTLDVAYSLEHPRFKDSVMTIKNFMRWIASIVMLPI